MNEPKAKDLTRYLHLILVANELYYFLNNINHTFMCLIIYYRQKSKDNSMIELQDDNIAIVTAKTKDFSRYDNTSLKCIRRKIKN